ncbi:hypothetical protein [Aestuariivirga sp.]|uniref:hypothetical protein n=1 Tax=Aestuariivirga sp. TaxID=2650926 RepID=UPI00391DC208
MRILAITLLTACQFTLFPFLAIVAANTARHQQEDATHVMYRADMPNVTTVYKTAQM